LQDFRIFRIKPNADGVNPVNPANLENPDSDKRGKGCTLRVLP
jgi:hypothetical protein